MIDYSAQISVIEKILERKDIKDLGIENVLTNRINLLKGEDLPQNELKRYNKCIFGFVRFLLNLDKKRAKRFVSEMNDKLKYLYTIFNTHLSEDEQQEYNQLVTDFNKKYSE